MEFGKELLILVLVCVLGNNASDCGKGHKLADKKCVDINECEDMANGCGNHTICFNTNGSYYCQCQKGFINIHEESNFTAVDGECQDVNECQSNGNICGRKANCTNVIGSFNCTCHFGYVNGKNNSIAPNCEDVDECNEAQMKEEDLCGRQGACKNINGSYVCICEQGYTNYGNERTPCSDVDECNEAQMKEEDLCGRQGACKNINGSYVCICEQGYTNYGNERTPCSELNCDRFGGSAQSLGVLANILSMMRNSCLALSNPSGDGEWKANGEALLENLLTATDGILSPGLPESSEGVSELLTTVENSILLIGPQLKRDRTPIDTAETEAEIAVQRGKTRPTGPIYLTNENASLNTDWTTAAGTGTYPGFALAALLSYKNLAISVNKSFEELKGHERDDVDPSFQVFSRVVSVVVSNPSTQKLNSLVNITLRHLQDLEESSEVKYICAYWNERGAWSTDGCDQQHSNATHTVCTCEHLSSFAVLMALYPMEHTFGLLLVTKMGLALSLVCLVLCILTFNFCRSIQGTRTTIHLHLCICLFMADLIFLAGISKTTPVGGCRFVAAMLHYYFLGVFSWMLLEGVQLYRMVVLVFNATIRPLYLYVTGYGVPLAIVIISAIIRPKHYGTAEHCWLSLKDGLIWSFYGPVCFIIILNALFFIITVWKLAQKFTSLNPDLSKLHKIKAFTVTAIAQMCILGLMWVFGAFLFRKEAIVEAYIFTILNSLQGALLFLMHCLLSKQVRDEYAHFLSCICTQEKKRYSDFSSTNPSSSQSQGVRSGQHTGESQI
ncbi:adhesion G protein-coupled receptor E5 [Embiotoca jacksoni]|uniref:adhesion G protein-coupled receptor E5 n=1 Tax=Embiotoca jacksoni TaxID=100190 RepID=UPI003703ED10